MNSFEKRWRKLSLIEQMANIGSEISRFINWKFKDKNYARQAYFRALELFDLTVSDPKNKNRLKEITRVREMLNDWFLQSRCYKSTDADWQKYFLQFALASRLKH